MRTAVFAGAILIALAINQTVTVSVMIPVVVILACLVTQDWRDWETRKAEYRKGTNDKS
jgi:hypothetical protein